MTYNGYGRLIYGEKRNLYNESYHGFSYYIGVWQMDRKHDPDGKLVHLDATIKDKKGFWYG